MKKAWFTGEELCDRWKIDTEELYGIIRDDRLPVHTREGKVTSLAQILNRKTNWRYYGEPPLREPVSNHDLMVDCLKSLLFWQDDIEVLESKHPRLACPPPFTANNPHSDPNRAAVERFLNVLTPRCRPWARCPAEKRMEAARDIIKHGDYLPLTIEMMTLDVFAESGVGNERRDIRSRLLSKIPSNTVTTE